MSPLDVALYENALVRVRTVAQFNDKKTKEAVEKAVEKATIESVKKLLLHGKLTIEEIADNITVSIDFVKEIQKSMRIS